MRIHLEIENKKTGFKQVGFVAFNVITSYSPVNLWILNDQGINTEYHIQSHDFVYKKIVAVMEVTADIDNHKFHGQVISCAYGESYQLSNLVINLIEENEEGYDWHQLNNDFECAAGNDVYIIDLDELRQSKGFEELSVDECFSKLLTNSSIGYDIRTLRFVDIRTGHIMDVNEHTPE